MAYAQILIIDENDRARALLAKQLTDLAYDVHTAKSLSEALAKLKTATANNEPYECICLGPMEHTSGLGYDVIYNIRHAGKHHKETLIIGASHDESFWRPMRNEDFFLTVRYGFTKTNESAWDTHTLRDYLPIPKAMAVI